MAPDFELKGHRNDEKVRLSDFRGKKNVVVVFYPLDWTPV
jgi:peroxiredoxin